MKAALSALVLWSGFRAVSDDDYARVAIAEAWAHAPGLDPSGTSWLPAPFWLLGTALRVFGRTLGIARGVSAALGVGSAVLIWLAARWLFAPRSPAPGRATRAPALAAALCAAVLPWSAILGVATVPELPAAALTLLAMASVASASRSSGRRRLWGGLALLLATLCRYETWPIAAGFAALSFRDAAAARRGERAPLLLSSTLALLGPAAWIAWNHHAHGDALHFLARVAAYRKALGGDEGNALSRLALYPLAMVRHEPELFALLTLLLAFAALRPAPLVRATLGPLARPIGLLAAQIAALSLAMVRDGAPTHHPERAVLVALLFAAMVAGALFVTLLAENPSLPRRLSLVGGGLIAICAGGVVRVQPAPEPFAHREPEEAIGRLASTAVPPGQRCLLEVDDYGYLAVTAAFGRPEDLLPDRTIDPRLPAVPSSFDRPADLTRRITETDSLCVLGRRTEASLAALGEPRATTGPWSLWASAAR